MHETADDSLDSLCLTSVASLPDAFDGCYIPLRERESKRGEQTFEQTRANLMEFWAWLSA